MENEGLPIRRPETDAGRIGDYMVDGI